MIAYCCSREGSDIENAGQKAEQFVIAPLLNDRSGIFYSDVPWIALLIWLVSGAPTLWSGTDSASIHYIYRQDLHKSSFLYLYPELSAHDVFVHPASKLGTYICTAQTRNVRY